MSYREVPIRITDATTLVGNLTIPDKPRALVIFSHGSGSSRYSTRNRLVADYLNKNNFATLLTDLLTTDEDRIFENRFDIELLTDRLVSVTKYVVEQPKLDNLPVGYFGASTGAASALKASAMLGPFIQAVVSRGGRPDLALPWLKQIQSPTLLIVGSLDRDVMTLNQLAFNHLDCRKLFKTINGASHLFEEPGKLEEVAQLANEWFTKFLIKEKVTLINNHR